MRLKKNGAASRICTHEAFATAYKAVPFVYSGIAASKISPYLCIRLRLDYMNIIKHRSLFPLDKDVLSKLSPLASFQIPTSALTVRRNLSFAIKVLVV